MLYNYICQQEFRYYMLEESDYLEFSDVSPKRIALLPSFMLAVL